MTHQLPVRLELCKTFNYDDSKSSGRSLIQTRKNNDFRKDLWCAPAQLVTNQISDHLTKFIQEVLNEFQQINRYSR